MGGKSGIVAIMAAVTFAAASLLPGPGLAAPAEDLHSLGKGNAAFALNLYRQMLAKEKGNLFFSPYSISLALAMAYAGAKGETAAQIARVLGFTIPAERVHPALAELSRRLEKVGNEAGQSLTVANAAWLNTSLKLLPDYLKLIRSHYSEEIKQLDFCQEEPSRIAINGWVAKKTRDRIKDLIPPGILDCDTMLVLTNAIYFLGHWAEKFDDKLTKPGPFWLTPGKKVETPFMHRTAEYAYSENDAWQALELPYREKKLSMLVLLPKSRGALAEVEKTLKPEMLEQIAGSLKTRKVEVSLPRFTVRSRLTLNPYLQAAGMVLAFGPQADFSGITDWQRLAISAVLHQAWVKVEEKGTEAAAATAVVVRKTAVPVEMKPVVFRADHPFLFFIKDRETGLILFMGRLADPKAPSAG
ncbi:MAG: serpin family protein [Deltaproteobacteria bacterium]|nr:serpin family protein [Deltaproteobacteria bacterium]